MPVIPLPDDPDLEQLRRQAKELRRAVAAGAPDAVAEAGAVHGSVPEPFRLSAAQLVLARRHGFASWPRLVAHVRLLHSLTRRPDEVGPQSSPADELLRLACLTYTSEDSVARRERAVELLAGDPSLGQASIHTAAGVADVDALRSFLHTSDDAARTVGGPFRWEPLLYLAYARLGSAVDGDAVAACVTALLDAGADPNAGYLWHGLASPFTVITGLLGEGELGPLAQPPHPRWQRLTRLVLERGGEANDSQGLYNRMFRPGTEHIELLVEFGLGRGDGGPWRARLGDTLASPQELIDGQLRWAATHGMVARAELLAAHGADGAAVIDDAARAGFAEVVAVLRAHGAPPPALDDVDGLIAALSVGRATTVDPRVLAAAKQRRPSLLIDAVAAGRIAAARTLLELGFDVNALGRGDQPINGSWETALHVAADAGRIDLIRLLLDHGADPAVRDVRFGATPLGWAEHAGRADAADVLRPLTPD